MYKNIRIPLKGGGSRLQRVKVLKSGKYKFVKNNPKSRKSRNPGGKGTASKSSKKKRGNPGTAKKNNSRKNSTFGGLNKVFTITRRIAPRLASHSGVPYMGYNVLESGIAVDERARRFATNELLISTGVDILGCAQQGKLVFNWIPFTVETLARVNPAAKISRMVNKIVRSM